MASERRASVSAPAGVPVPIAVRMMFVSVAAGCTAAVVFISFPEIDLGLSRLFYDPETQLFPFWQAWFFRFINDLVEFVAVVAGSIVVIGVGASSFLRRPVLALDLRRWIYLLSCLVVGPGLIANALFKEMWGRARPRHLLEFGGSLDFTSALILSDQCAGNCSFVSGDTAFAFTFLAPALLIGRRRPLAIAAAVGFGAFVASIRIAQGAHFLSDTIFAGVFMALTVSVLHLALVEKRRSETYPLPPSAPAGWRRPLWLFFRARPEDLGVPPDTSGE